MTPPTAFGEQDPRPAEDVIRDASNRRGWNEGAKRIVNLADGIISSPDFHNKAFGDRLTSGLQDIYTLTDLVPDEVAARGGRRVWNDAQGLSVRYDGDTLMRHIPRRMTGLMGAVSSWIVGPQGTGNQPFIQYPQALELSERGMTELTRMRIWDAEAGAFTRDVSKPSLWNAVRARIGEALGESVDMLTDDTVQKAALDIRDRFSETFRIDNGELVYNRPLRFFTTSEDGATVVHGVAEGDPVSGSGLARRPIPEPVKAAWRGLGRILGDEDMFFNKASDGTLDGTFNMEVIGNWVTSP
jgi:hypothetical protein